VLASTECEYASCDWGEKDCQDGERCAFVEALTQHVLLYECEYSSHERDELHQKEQSVTHAKRDFAQ
jgi:hypothetical protein